MNADRLRGCFSSALGIPVERVTDDQYALIDGRLLYGDDALGKGPP